MAVTAISRLYLICLQSVAIPYGQTAEFESVLCVRRESTRGQMAIKKTTAKKKTVAKKAMVVAEVVTETAPKPRKKTYTKKRVTALLDQMLTQFAEQLSGKPLSYSAADGLKMMQMRENAEPERPTEVKVGWVEEPRT